MKKNLYFILLLFTIQTHAQDYRSIGWESNFGFGFGPEFNIHNFDYSGFIKQYKNLDYSIPSQFNSIGYSGFIYLMLVENLRVGLKGFSVNDTKNNYINNEVKSSKVEISSFGLTVEYTLPIFRKPSITIGFEIGSEKAEFLFHHYNKELGSSDWSKIDDPALAKSLFSINFKDKFYIFTPLINVDYPVSRFILIRGGFGYQIPFNHSITYYNDLKNESISKLINNGTVLSIGIFIGFFAF